MSGSHKNWRDKEIHKIDFYKSVSYKISKSSSGPEVSKFFHAQLSRDCYVCLVGIMGILTFEPIDSMRKQGFGVSDKVLTQPGLCSQGKRLEA